MADFTRFISYLYDYRAGERNRNLGFAKIESRQGMCRLTVNLNHGQVLQQKMVLCGYLVEGDNVYLVRLGEMEEGIRERQWRFPADDLGGCGLGLERLSGLVLLCQAGDFFLLSVWKDEGRTAQEICRAEFWDRKRACRGREMSPGMVTGQNEEPDKYEGSSGRPDKYAESLKRPDESAESAGRPDESAESSKRSDDTEIERETESQPKRSVAVSRRENEGDMNRQNDQYRTDNADDHTRYQIDGENDQIARRVLMSGEGTGVDSVRGTAPPPAAPEAWRALCKLFPAARPFEPSAWEVLCISLQDIGRLPPENWVWGSNHFLLHGYYQYHHLILARQRNENRIYLGVPGEFGTNETFMAAMFGLHQFQRERRGKSDKGYWLTPIRL